jgi:CRP-like cAMP-binding protein
LLKKSSKKTVVSSKSLKPRQEIWEQLSRNAILHSLSEEDRAVVLKRGELVDFQLRQAVYEPDQTIDAAYFPLDCVLSVVTHMIDGSMIEIGTIGREGTSAVPLVLGAVTTANESFCQVPGTAWKMPADDFIELVDSSKPFRTSMNRYLQGYLNMLGQIAACNRLHNALERCARWLLMTQDRVEGNKFPMTHEFLATMLGSQRSSVTVSAAILQKAGYIKYERGNMTILDRPGLEEVTCECYTVASQQFANSIKLKLPSNFKKRINGTEFIIEGTRD